VSEPLTGRKFEYILFPFSFEELANHYGLFEEHKNLASRLIYGTYPDVVVNDGDKREILENLVSGYLYKDILAWNKIKKADKIVKLLQALAFQIGNLVSYNELAETVGLNTATVEHYIDLLEKTFVIFKLNSFSRNLRNELKKSKKIYFYDNGIRNTLINNFTPDGMREDMGALWENYLISERIKFTHYHRVYSSKYFWRTKNKNEIDYIEERDGKLFAYEFRWNVKKKTKIPKAFTNAYPEAEVRVITPENYFDFIFPVQQKK
jgi:predicted AAA+ superfamily ATPase